MKYIILIISILVFSASAFAIDSAEIDEGCGGKPKPDLPLGCNNADISCVCNEGVCDWVVSCN